MTPLFLFFVTYIQPSIHLPRRYIPNLTTYHHPFSPSPGHRISPLEPVPWLPAFTLGSRGDPSKLCRSYWSSAQTLQCPLLALMDDPEPSPWCARLCCLPSELSTCCLQPSLHRKPRKGCDRAVPQGNINGSGVRA